jgi:hypothetical protein
LRPSITVRSISPVIGRENGAGWNTITVGTRSTAAGTIAVLKTDTMAIIAD